MSQEGLEALRARVHADAELARRLRRLEPDALAAEVLRAAAACGDDVTQRDLDEAMQHARRDWMLRWVR